MAATVVSAFSKRPRGGRSEHSEDLPSDLQDFPANRHDRVYEPYGQNWRAACNQMSSRRSAPKFCTPDEAQRQIDRPAEAVGGHSDGTG
jgi:hypothetical protein